MRHSRSVSVITASLRSLAVVLAVLAATSAALAQAPSLEALVSSVVRVKARITPDGRSAETLGRERDGSGIVIDDGGLVLTIGYLMVEADAVEITTDAGRSVPASVVGYDHETGFGLVRAIVPVGLRPMPFGKSADLKPGDPVLVASFGGIGMVAPAAVVARREFAGSWEYLLDEAIFTAPPHPAWSGAALVSREGKLVGVGSLIVGDAAGGRPGNMFVPIDLLPPILGDLIAAGRVPGPGRPWLGVTTSEMHGGLVVTRVSGGSPAQKAGLKHGDVIVGIGGERPTSQAEFYRKLWAQGSAGAVVTLDVLHNNEMRRVEVKSMNRLDHLKLRSSL
jgi:S1-C subfamily serine protease